MINIDVKLTLEQTGDIRRMIDNRLFLMCVNNPSNILVDGELTPELAQEKHDLKELFRIVSNATDQSLKADK